MNYFKAVLIVIIFIPTIYGAQECLPPAQQRDLIILSDTASEEYLEAFGRLFINDIQTDTLERMLASQAAPVLVQRSIWKRFAEQVKEIPRSWLHQSDYEFYHVGPYLLCIPIAWKEKYPNTGFNLSNFERIANPFDLLPTIIDPIKPFIKTWLMWVYIYRSLVTQLRKLLTPSMYAWNIMLFGHGGPLIGSYQSRVAGLPMHEFRRLLRFLKSEIKTNILLYSTCFGGSKWLMNAYKTWWRQDTYPFPIVLIGVTEAPVFGFTSGNTENIFAKEIYNTFFTNIKTIPLCRQHLTKIGINTGIALQALKYNRAKERYKLIIPNNILQIRWPGEEQFEVIELEHIVQVANNNNLKPTINVASDALVIQERALNANIQLTEKKQALVSGIPKHWHRIQSAIVANAESREQMMKQLLSSFTMLKRLATSKRILIDRAYNSNAMLQAKKLMVLLHSRTPSSWIRKKDELFYYADGKGYLLLPNDEEPRTLHSWLTQWYLYLYALGTWHTS